MKFIKIEKVEIRNWIGEEEIAVKFIDRKGKNQRVYLNVKEDTELSKLTSSELYEFLSSLIDRLKHTDAPNEENGIEKFSKMIIQQLEERSKDQNTRRNKLIRYLRDEIQRLKK